MSGLIDAVVGSTNLVKVEAAKEAFAKANPGKEIRISGRSVSSDVSDQPIGINETIRGAFNRLKKISDAAEKVAFENGLVSYSDIGETEPAWFDIGVAAYADPFGGMSCWQTQPLKIPADLLNPASDAASQMEHYSAKIMPLIREKKDLYDVFSNGKASRGGFLSAALATQLKLRQLGFVPEQISKLDRLLRKNGKLVLPTGRKCKVEVYSLPDRKDTSMLCGYRWRSAALSIIQLLHHCSVLNHPSLQHVQLGVYGVDVYIWKGIASHKKYADPKVLEIIHEIFAHLSLGQDKKILLDILPVKQPNALPLMSSEQAIRQMEIKTLELWKQAENVKLEWKREYLDPDIEHLWYNGGLFGSRQNIHVIKYNQSAPHLSMVVSKTSESHRPNEPLNYLGSAHPLKQVVDEQTDAIIGINGTYFDYTHTYYPIDRDSHVGDPVLPSIIREHEWSPPISPEANFHYLVQVEKKLPFRLMDLQDVKELNCQPKYLLSCSPPLIMKGRYVTIRETKAAPLLAGAINPPGHLGHLFALAARTVVASDDKGYLLFVTVDGPASGKGEGMDYAQLIALMRVMGVKDAGNLDGGGSTAIWCRRSKNQPPELLNAQPQQEQMRDIGNALLIFNSDWPRKI